MRSIINLLISYYLLYFLRLAAIITLTTENNEGIKMTHTQEIKTVTSLLNSTGTKARADYKNMGINLKDSNEVSRIQAIYPHLLIK